MNNCWLDLFAKQDDKAFRKDGEIIHPRKFIAALKQEIAEINTWRTEENQIVLEQFEDGYCLIDKANMNGRVYTDIDGLFDWYVMYRFINLVQQQKKLN